MSEADEAMNFAEAMMRSYNHPSDVVIPPTAPLRIDGRRLTGIEAHNVTQAFAHAYRAGQAASAERIKALEEALGALANAADNVGIAFFDSDDMPAEAEAMQAATLDARAQLREADQSGANLLQWLIEHTDLELSFRHSDDPDEGVWCVYRRQGSANDREWCLIARGQTPWQALFLARKAIAKEADQ